MQPLTCGPENGGRGAVAGSGVVVAIPARNEAAELPGCLAALAAQQGGAVDHVVLCLNDCTDDSAAVVRQVAGALPFVVHALEVALPPEQACAGLARRMAMDHAADLAGPGGILLTTDADGRAPADWVAGNLAALAAGADAVAGRAEIEPQGARLIPAHLHALDARECGYAALLDEIRWLIDPDPADPWPRHDEHCGASIAVTVAAYRRAGGMPAVPLAEDRVFFQHLRQVDARIRHAPEVRVVVSARLHGRAPGGMADTMRRRIVHIDPYLDSRLEPAIDAIRRARLCAALRARWRAGCATPTDLQQLAARLQLPAAWLSERFALVPASPAEALVSAALAPAQGTPWIESAAPAVCFGAGWAWVEQQSPALQRRLVPVGDLAAETARARRMRDRLRRAADPAGRMGGAAAAPAAGLTYP